MDSAHSRRGSGTSDKYFLESIEIDNIEGELTDLGAPQQDQLPPTLPKSGSKSTLGRLGSTITATTKNVVKGFVPRRDQRSQSGMLTGLNSIRFIDKKKIGNQGDGWKDVEKRFHQMAVDGRLTRDKFGMCVGMGDSMEFAAELFDTLARRRKVNTENGIDWEQLKFFWDDIAKLRMTAP